MINIRKKTTLTQIIYIKWRKCEPYKIDRLYYYGKCEGKVLKESGSLSQERCRGSTERSFHIKCSGFKGKEPIS